ncbi:hypothetical protein NUSPORA_00433 [Nucleospora cyclopteri]
MSEHGPRVNKLKEVFKRAITEMLKKDRLMQEDPKKDSFYSDSQKETIRERSEEVIDALISTIRSKFSHIFKEKLIETNLEQLMNNLDRDIKNKRVNSCDIRDKKYITEIFESSIADSKENILNLLNDEIESAKKQMSEIDGKIKAINKAMKEVREENTEYELKYKEIIKK